MFEPDVLIPGQYRALQGKVLSAEPRLLFAVLEEAIHSYKTHIRAMRPRDRQIFREAEEWIESVDTQWFFSFENVCEILGLSADSVRQAMQEWKTTNIDAVAQQRLK
jgi:hypothetical protein